MGTVVSVPRPTVVMLEVEGVPESIQLNVSDMAADLQQEVASVQE